MKKKKKTWIHYVILIIGTLLYLYNYQGFIWHSQVGDSPKTSHLNVDDFAFFCRTTMFYISFVVLVFGHALLWHSPLDSLDSDDSDKKLQGDNNEEPKNS